MYLHTCTQILVKLDNLGLSVLYSVYIRVIFYLSPLRIGRSGRFGRKGVAINFVKNDDIRILRDIEQYYSTQIDEMPMNGMLLNSSRLQRVFVCSEQISVHPRSLTAISKTSVVTSTDLQRYYLLVIFKLTVLFAKMDEVFSERNKNIKRVLGKNTANIRKNRRIWEPCVLHLLSHEVYSRQNEIKSTLFYFQLLILFKEHGFFCGERYI